MNADRGRRCMSMAVGCAVVVALTSAVVTGEVPEDHYADAAAGSSTPIVPALYYPFPADSGAIAVHTAVTEDDAGTIYVGSSCYDSWAKVFRFKPGVSTGLEVLYDVGDLIGQKHYPTERHSKIHTPLLRDVNGWIYAGTKVGHEHFGERAMYGTNDRGFTGGVLLRFDPRTGLAQNLGIPRPGDGLMGMVYDSARHRIWALSDPRCELLRIDLTDNAMAVHNLGKATRYLEGHINIDGKGNVWLESRPLHLLRVDAETGRMDEFPVVGVDQETWGGHLKQRHLSLRHQLLLVHTREHNRLVAISLRPRNGQLQARVLADLTQLHPNLNRSGYSVLDEQTDRLFMFPSEIVSRTERRVHVVSVHLASGEMTYHGRLQIVNHEGIQAGAPLATMVSNTREIVFPGAGFVRGFNWYGTRDGAGLYRIGPIERILGRGPAKLEMEGEGYRYPPVTTPPGKFKVATLDDVVPFGERRVTSIVRQGQTLLAACVGKSAWRLVRVDLSTEEAAAKPVVVATGELDDRHAPYAIDLVRLDPDRFLMVIRRQQIDTTKAQRHVDGWRSEAVPSADGGFELRERPAPDLLRFFNYPGSQLMVVTTSGADVQVTPLGVPLDGDDLVAATAVGQGRTVIGYSLIGGDLVRVSLAPDRIADAQVLRAPAEKGPPTPVTGPVRYDRLNRRHVPTALLTLRDGRVLGSGKDGRLLVVDPQSDSVQWLSSSLPELLGRHEFAVLAGAVQLPDGSVVGVTDTGRVFTLDLETGRVVDRGKPLRQGGALPIVFNPADGLVYGACSEPFGIDRLFAFNPATSGYVHLGVLSNLIAPGYYEYRYARVGALAVTPDGRLVVGEADNLADLELWPPQGATDERGSASDE